MNALQTFYYRHNKHIPAMFNQRIGKDAGYDLYALKDMWFFPFQTRAVPTNAMIHIPKGYYGHVTARSGWSTKGWLVHTGVIDHGYHGTIHSIMTNLSFWPRKIKAGDRVCQMIFAPFKEIESMEIDDEMDFISYVYSMSMSDRCQKGFGNSGM
jgi:dUTP pyrophosphatase